MKEKLEQLRKKAQEELSKITDKSLLSDFEVKFLGRKGELAKLTKELKDLPADLRPEVGKLANEVKMFLHGELGQKLGEFGDKMLGKGSEDFFDHTLPGTPPQTGHLHPITKTRNEVVDVFSSMGFMVLDGPFVETDYYAFEALNIPKDHPARDMQDTFYTTDNNVLRPHTSSVQVRAMLEYGAPLRSIVPGEVFRNEATDATHEASFCQVEGLVVDEGISIAHLIMTLKTMLSEVFGEEVKVRLRPGYFSFVEPGFEMDFACLLCEGKGCKVCKQTGWVEFLGCGMVHSLVLKAGKIDSKKYSGFAFGMGLDRLIMMRHGISDIRLFRSGNMKFLEQF